MGLKATVHQKYICSIKFDTELEKKINENNNKLRDARESVDKLNKERAAGKIRW